MSKTSSAVALLDPNSRLGLARGRPVGRVPLSDCIWPLGCPEHLLGKHVRDLGPQDHLISFGRTLPPGWPTPGLKARWSIVLAEPSVIQGSFQKRVARHAARFHRILSYNAGILSSIPNGIFFPYGTTWVPNWDTSDLTKSKLCSLIASAKRSQPGHVLRHEVADWSVQSQQPIDLLGHGYASFADKADGLAPYRYSVVIENSQEENYFTEKLIDAVLCQTVPIYWGCPNLDAFMDTSGMMICNSFDDVQAALSAMSDDDYANRLPALRRAIPAAATYADLYARAAQALVNDGPVP